MNGVTLEMASFFKWEKLLRAIEWRMLAMALKPVAWDLAIRKREQRRAFDALVSVFADSYMQLMQHGPDPFLTPFWTSCNERLGLSLFPRPSFGFLRNRLLRNTMHAFANSKWRKEELALLEERYSPARLRAILEEDYVGRPLIMNSKYVTSHNSIHHLYHIVRFLDATGTNLSHMHCVVEWGGGYGNLAKIFMRCDSTQRTFVIIDSPLFSCLQWLYLSVAVGETHVFLVTDESKRIQPGKINLLPLAFVDALDLPPDLFVATWSLSESSSHAIEYVVNRNWFNPRHLLLAGQARSDTMPQAEAVRRHAELAGAKSKPIRFIPGNWYSFR